MQNDVCMECLTSQENIILKTKIQTELKNAVLGEDFYVVDPLGGCQACEYILDKCIEQHKSLKEYQSLPWYKKAKRWLIAKALS